MLRTPDGSVLIDAGLQRSAQAILKALEDLDWPRSPATVFLTHAHGDHASGAVGLCRRHGTKILGHPGVADILAAADEQETGDEWMLARCPAQRLLDGQSFRFGEATLTGFCTPGHTADGMAYLVEVDGLRCLFSGDLVMRDLNPGWRGDPHFSIEDTIHSLERLMALEPDRLFTGHSQVEGEPMEFLRSAAATGRSGRWSG